MSLLSYNSDYATPPATFQQLMETVLAGLARDACMVYLDDILVLGSTLEEHLQNLAQVFNCLRKAGLRLKPTKCHLAWKKIAYLGFIGTDMGVAANPQKIEAVRSYPTPTNLVVELWVVTFEMPRSMASWPSTTGGLE